LKKIVITGGAGFIGAALASRLAAEGDSRIIAIDNVSSGYWARIEGNVEKREIDISTATPELIREIIKDADQLFHLAAVKLHNTENSFASIVDNNITAAQNIFEAAGLAEVKRVIFASSLYVYGLPNHSPIEEACSLDPQTFYGSSKVFGEHSLRINSEKFDYSAVTARLFFVYGPKQYARGGYKSVIINNFERMIAHLPPVVNGQGNQILDYVYIDDCVEALRLLGESLVTGEYNVSSNSGTSIIDLTKTMLAIGNSRNFTFAPPDWTENTMRIGSNDKISAAISWKPRVTLCDGLTRTWESMQK
jgi:UDP-glucose 4-epimerase